MKVIKINKDASTPSIINGLIEFKAIDVLAEVARDGRVVIGMKTGLKVILDKNETGIIFAPENAPGYSLYQAGGTQIHTSANDGELIIRYKVNTDSMPAIWEKDDVVGRMIIVNNNDINIDFADETITTEHEKPTE